MIYLSGMIKGNKIEEHTVKFIKVALDFATKYGKRPLIPLGMSSN